MTLTSWRTVPSMGPSAFRIGGLAEQLTALGMTVVDKGDIASPIPEAKGPGDPRKRYVKQIARVCQKLFQTTVSSLEAGALPIVLGGDHSLAAGSVAASAAYVRRKGKPLGLIWVDAHGDMPTASAPACPACSLADDWVGFAGDRWWAAMGSNHRPSA